MQRGARRLARYRFRRDPPRSGPLAAPRNASTLLTWTEVSSQAPANSTGAGLAADGRAEAIRFGGVTAGELTNQTLEYDESTDQWSFLTEAHAPSPRAGLALAADGATGTAVLFGGTTNQATGASVNDTWVFDFASGSWTNLSKLSAPAPREQAAFAIDPSLGLGLLFGGWDPDFQGTGEVTYSDTWELNLTTDNWTRVVIAAGSGPPAVHGAMMDWDPSAGEFDLFGGCYPCSNDLWQFDPVSGTWTEAAAAGGHDADPAHGGGVVVRPVPGGRPSLRRNGRDRRLRRHFGLLSALRFLVAADGGRCAARSL